MAEARQVLARLTEGTQRLDGLGGLPELTQADVAFALGCILDKLTACLLRLKWVYDESVRDECERRLLFRLADEVQKWGWVGRQRDGTWRRLGKGVLRGYIRVALIEWQYPDRCVRCRGTGRRPALKGAGTILCRPCGGTGNHEVSMREKSVVAGIDHKSWRDDRFYRVLNLIYDLEKEGLNVVRDVLS